MSDAIVLHTGKARSASVNSTDGLTGSASGCSRSLEINVGYADMHAGVNPRGLIRF